MFDYKNLLIEQIETGIVKATVNRPRALNALNIETMRELGDMTEKIGARKDVHVVIITGAGDKSFVAGADIDIMSDMGLWEGREWGVLGGMTGQRIEEMPQMVIAAVNGYALGGGAWLATSCNLRIASEKAVFGAPEVKLGIMAGFGWTQTLPRIIGVGNALDMLTTGRFIKADEALRMGLVNRVVPHEQLMDAALEMARMICANGPIAVRLTKRAVYEGLSMPLAASRIYERELHGLCFTTQDQKEGMAAFLEKRTPHFENK